MTPKHEQSVARVQARPDQRLRKTATVQLLQQNRLAATDFVFYAGSTNPPPPDPQPPSGTGVTITGTSGKDTIDATHAPTGQAFATNYNDTISGLAGNDVISGLDGDDTIEGGAGTDQVNGGNGNDKFLVSGSSNDVSDTFNGGAGTDTLQVTGSGALTLAKFDATASSIESWLGNGQALLGNNSTNTFDFTGLTSATGLSYVDGGSGNDTIRGGALVHDLRGGSGNDTLAGGDGDDTLNGGAGADSMSGGGGNDRFVVSGSDAASDTFNGGAGTDTIQVTGSGALSLNGFNATTASIESWQGNSQPVTGSTASNTFDFSGLTAISGLSYIDGGSGNDTLVGSAFADDLRGGNGNDKLTGGGGNDMLSGGAGTDTFTFGSGFGQDKIVDFALSGSSADVIQFTAGTFANFNAVKAAMQQVGSDVLITLDAGNTVTIANVSISQLQANDFLFS